MLFSKYTPLGFNCEVGFLLEQRGYPQNDEFFAWTELQPAAIRMLIDDEFDDVGGQENLRIHPYGHLVIDGRYDVSFHSPLVGKDKNTFGTPSFERLHHFFKAGLERKAQLFMAGLRSEQSIAYVIKYCGVSARADAVALRDTIAANRPTTPFVLAFVQEGDRTEADWGEVSIVNRYVDHFTPIHAANDVDHGAWDAALFDVQVAQS